MAAVCHAPSVLLNVKDANGGLVLFLLEDELKRAKEAPIQKMVTGLNT